jgi:hypothetical protein
LYTYVNKSDDPARTKRRNDRKKADAAYIAKLVKAQARTKRRNDRKKADAAYIAKLVKAQAT